MANEFCTIADVKTFLGIADANSDTALATLCTLISGAIRTYLSRDIYPETSYTKSVDGNGKAALLLHDSPINSVQSLSINGVDIPARPSWDGVGYTIDKNTLRLSGYTFEKGTANVAVSFKSGSASVPDEIKLCAVMWVAQTFQRRKNLDIASRSIGQENIAYVNDPCPKNVALILDQWKAVTPYARG